MEMEHWKKIDYYRNNLQLCRNGKTLSEMLPKNWCKFGEVYVTAMSQMCFLCCICMEYAEHFRQVFSSCDSRDFQEHLKKQHGIELSPDTTNIKGSIRRQCSTKAINQSLNILVRPPHITSDTMAPAFMDATGQSAKELTDDITCSSDEFTSVDTRTLPTMPAGKRAAKRKTRLPETENYSTDSSSDFNGRMQSVREDFVSSGSELNEHMKEHFWNYGNGSSSRKVSTRPYKCDVCGKRTLSVMALENHKVRFHGPATDSGTIACDICHKSVLRSNIHQHMLVHTNLRFFCPCCTSSYKQKQTLTLHMKRFHEDCMDLIPLYPLDPREVEARRIALQIAEDTL